MQSVPAISFTNRIRVFAWVTCSLSAQARDKVWFVHVVVVFVDCNRIPLMLWCLDGLVCMDNCSTKNWARFFGNPPQFPVVVRDVVDNEVKSTWIAWSSPLFFTTAPHQPGLIMLPNLFWRPGWISCEIMRQSVNYNVLHAKTLAKCL